MAPNASPNYAYTASSFLVFRFPPCDITLVAILAVAQQWGWRQQMLVMLYLTLQTANEQQLMQPRAVMQRL